MRLVGTLYFKKHYAAMVSLKGAETPTQLFNAYSDTTDSKAKHLLWYNDIRTIVGEHIVCEEERMPSHTSLWRHWSRSCWVGCMWQNTAREDLFEAVPPHENSGWLLESDGTYVYDWECPIICTEHDQRYN